MKVAYVFAGILAAASVACSASADEKLMIPLTEDVSRAQLFARLKPANLEVLPKEFAFPQDAQFDGPAPRKDAYFGIDVSHHNEDDCHCQIDWSALRTQSVMFVYLKASQGNKYYDATFDRNWKAIGQLPTSQKLYRGAYHFLSSDLPPLTQAAHFLRVIPSLSASDLPGCLDLEWDNHKGSDGKLHDSWQNVAPQEIADRALTWLKEVEAKTGRAPIIYTNRIWWKERIGEEKEKLFAHYNIWIADYSRSGLATEVPAVPADGPWLLWQFSERAKFTQGGLSTSVDANIFKGKKEDLLAKLGVPE